MELDAVVLAGEREGAKLIRGTNKALLPLRGRPIISYVIEALAGASRIHEIYVVGPAERLEQGLKDFAFKKPVHYVAQKENVFENIWTGFFASLPEDVRNLSSKELVETRHADKPVFVITCDTPLLRAEEVDSFIESANLEDIEVVLGVTQKELLLPFAPEGETPGIEFAYFCLREFIVRHSNIYIIKPLRLAKILEEYIPLIYGLRYQKQIRNMIRASATLLRLGVGLRPLYMFLAFQIGRTLDARGFRRTRDLLRKRVPKKMVVDYLYRALQTRVSILLTKSPGPALDIDNEPHLDIAEKMFDRWQEILSQILAGTYDLPSP
jgi:molybdopterin-guanine dinucleotide biosynthesis protein A